MSIRNWWVTNGTRPPIGPVSTELLVEGIKAEKVPSDCLVCEVGGSRWLRLTDVPDFLAASLAPRRRSRAPVPDAEHTVVDMEPLPPSEHRPTLTLSRADDFDEKTVVESRPPISGPLG